MSKCTSVDCAFDRLEATVRSSYERLEFSIKLWSTVLIALETMALLLLDRML